MPEKLDAETKRLRALSPAQLADEVGAHKAQIAAVEDSLGRVKAEGVRRGLGEFDSEIYHCTLTPPGISRRIDKDMLGTVFGPGFVEHFSKDIVGREWILRCFARPARRSQAA